MNATEEKYQEEDMKESYILHLQCRILAPKRTFKLTKSIEALKEKVDAAVKMFKIYDSTAVDSNDDEDGMDYLSESSGGETDW